MKDLGTLGGPNASVGAMNNNGDVSVGGSDTGKPDPLNEDFCGFHTHQTCLSFIWHHGTRTLIPTLGGNNNDVATINDAGLVLAVGEKNVRDASCVKPQVLGFEAFTWSPRTNKIHRLPPLKGDSDSEAFAMNERGDAVGYSGGCGTGGDGDFFVAYHAVIWLNGKPRDMGSFGGTFANLAFGINTRDQVAGISALRGDKTAHAFIWQNGVMKDLGTLSGDQLSLSGNINDAGQVPIQSCKSVSVPKCRAALWDNGTMTDLNSLVQSRTSLYLTSANWINNHGDIVGTARDRNTGATVPFLAIRCDPAGVQVRACN
jgi:probable HAF family extracellular repeat protein